ncbi:MAG: 1-deoxy-D-xylulose-5-phosphate synthase [Clostridia bacterium]|nr:1-deoxy-D-xylulose-5-phosphate synthase [Clostridia bacterium]
MNDRYLDKVQQPGVLEKLSQGECTTLCTEIREELIERVTKNGGHLASNLGVVELTVALHRAFDLPKDRIIFDVSHQAYVHKLLSGRLAQFETLRTPGGLSGFQKRDESDYDAFGGGHASTSLSAALGFAQADRVCGRDNYTVAVVGDGAFTGGMIHEALNNCQNDLRLIIILNENEMSISPNTGHFASYISNIRSSKEYFGIKRKAKRFFSKNATGKKVIHFLSRQKERIKGVLLLDNYFEQMGIKYLGPIDGHDQQKLELLLSEAKQNACCTLIHIKTVKGKGHKPAEEHPDRYHGIAPAGSASVPTFSAHFGTCLETLAQDDPRICAITAAMADGTGLSGFAKKFPQRFFDVGIAEEHALTFAAGLSAAGMKPVFAIYSTFLQRSYDQLIHDAALQNLPLVLAVDRAGFAKADGPTHHGLFDVSMALSLPQSQIFAPLTFDALDEQLRIGIASDALTFIRYRSGGQAEHADELPYIYKEGFLRASISDGPLDGAILTYGQLSGEALKAQKAAKRMGKRIALLVLEKLTPDPRLLRVLQVLLKDCPALVFAEEGVRNGGAGELYKRTLLPLLKNQVSFTVLAVDNPFLLATKEEDLYSRHELSAAHIVKAILSKQQI